MCDIKEQLTPIAILLYYNPNGKRQIVLSVPVPRKCNPLGLTFLTFRNLF